MNKYKMWKEKNRLLFALLKVFLNRKNSRFMDLVLYGEEGIIYRNLGKNPLKKQKKALICYLTNAQDEQELCDVTHTNIEEKYIITQCFLKKGFQVDICDCRNTGIIRTLFSNSYDVIFGFGPAYQLACKQWDTAFCIEYFTESPYWYSKKKESERVEYYSSRTGKRKKLYRTGMFYAENDEYCADAIICMCEKSLFDARNIPVYKICPHGLYNSNYCFERVHERDSRSFLFFGTAGYIHKGLDIVIEVFRKMPNLKLYVCGGLNAYLQDNKSVPDNIFDCGNINVQSERYLELVAECEFVLLPSCSEASPSGVITCMRHGLIPIITRGLGLDFLEEYCFLLDDYKIEYLCDKIHGICEMTDAEVNDRRKEIFRYANENFSLESFANNFEGCINNILGEIVE